MKRIRNYLFIGAVTAVFFMNAEISVAEALKAAAPDAAVNDAHKDDHAKGEKIFNNKCVKCHGAKGVGTTQGPPLVHKFYYPNHHADVTFYWAVERGVRAHHWNFGDMPPIEGVSKDDTALIIKYVRRIQKDAGAPF